MNFEQLIMTIIQGNDTQKRQQNILSMSQKIIKEMEHLDELEDQRKLKQQLHLFEGFFKVIEKISIQVKETKKKYEHLDKEKLKEQKCLNLAKDIKLFKQQCFFLKNKLTQTKKALKTIRVENEIMEEQQKSMGTVFQRKKAEKNKIKQEYMSEISKRPKYQNEKNLSFDNSKDKSLESDFIQYANVSKPKLHSMKKRNNILSFSHSINPLQLQQEVDKDAFPNSEVNYELIGSRNNRKSNPNYRTVTSFNPNARSVKSKQKAKNSQTAQFKRFISTSQQPRNREKYRKSEVLDLNKFMQLARKSSHKPRQCIKQRCIEDIVVHDL